MLWREYPVYDQFVDYQMPVMPDTSHSYILLSRIKTCHFEYFYADKWQTSLINEIPAMVKIVYTNYKDQEKVIIAGVQSNDYYKKKFSTYLYSPY